MADYLTDAEVFGGDSGYITDDEVFGIGAPEEPEQGFGSRVLGELKQLGSEFASGVTNTVSAVKNINVATQMRRLQETEKQIAELEAKGRGEGVDARMLRGEVQSLRERVPYTIASAAEGQASAQEAGQRTTRPAVAKLNEAKTLPDAWEAFKEAPYDVIAGVTATSLPTMLPALAVAMTTGPLAGAGAMGLSSGAAEFGSSLSEFASEAGVDTTDAKAVQAFFGNPDNLSQAMTYAGKRAGIIGALDAASGGIAGKTIAPAIKSTLARQAINLPAQMGVQAGLGAGGEALGQVATKGEVERWGPVVAEAVGELGGAPLEVAAFSKDARQALRRDPVQDIMDAPDVDSAIEAAAGAVLALPAPGTVAPGETILTDSEGRAGTAADFAAVRRQRPISEGGAFSLGRGSDIVDVPEVRPPANTAAAGMLEGTSDPLAQMLEDRRVRTEAADAAAAQAAAQREAELAAIPEIASEQNAVQAALDRAGALESPTAMELALRRAQTLPAPAIPAEEAMPAEPAQAPEPRIVPRTPDMVALPKRTAQLRAEQSGGEVVRIQNKSGKFAYTVLEPARAPEDTATEPAPAPAPAAGAESGGEAAAVPVGQDGADRQDSAPVQPDAALRFQRNKSGTLSVFGNPQEVKARLAELGIARAIPAKEGVLVPVSEAGKAERILTGLADNAPTPEAQALDKIAQQPAPRPLVEKAPAANPFKTFLIRNGIALRLAREFAPGTRERLAMGRTFRNGGLELDALAERAAEQGYIRDRMDTDELYALIAKVASGERVAPMYGQDAEAEMAAIVDRQRALEEDAAQSVGDLTEGELAIVEEVLDDIPALDAQSNASPEDAMRALGFTEQEIRDATAERTRVAQADRQGAGQPEQGAAREAPADRAGSEEAQRFAAGRALSKEQRRSVLKTLVDVYKAKGAPREQKGIGRDGNERYGYVHSPELFEKSDITGAMVRYYVTLPDGRIAHPSELFPDYTQADIDRAMIEQENAQRHDEADQRSVEEAADKFAAPTKRDAALSFNKRNPAFQMRDWRTGIERHFVFFEKGGKFYAVVSDDQKRMERMERAGWTRAGDDVLTAPTPADVIAQQEQREAEQQRRDEGGDKPAPVRSPTRDQIDLLNPQGGIFDAPAAPEAAAEGGRDEIDRRIEEAEKAGVTLSDADKAEIRETLERAADLNRKAGRTSALGSDPLNKGNAFPLGVGFTRETKRSNQRIDASVRRAGEAVVLWKKAEQAEKYAEALLAGKNTEADKLKKEAKREEARRALVDKIVNWKQGDKIGGFTIERVNKDRDGYPATYTISGDGIVKGVMDKVDVVREFFDGDKEGFRAMVDAARATPDDAPQFSLRDQQEDDSLSYEEVEKIVKELTAKWQNRPDIRVLDSMSEAPPKVLKQYLAQRSQGTHSRVHGFHLEGIVYIVAEEMTSRERVQEVLFHEALGHHGLRGWLGDMLRPMLADVILGQPDKVKAKAKAYGLNMNKQADRLMAAEEVLAELAQTRPELGVIRRLVAAIRTWLRDNVPAFAKMKMTDDELIRKFIIPARGFVERGQSPRPTFTIMGDEGPETVFSLGENAGMDLSDLREAYARYNETFESTALDLLEEVDNLIADGRAPVELAESVENFRQEIADDHELAGRGDLDEAENRFVEAVEYWLNKGAADEDRVQFSLRSAVTNKVLPKTWQAPDESKLDDFIYTVQDKHIDTKRAVQAVRDAIGRIADEQDPYLQEELFHGRAAMATKEFLEKQLRPLLVEMQARGVEMSDFEEYLHNRHAERRNVQVARVNPKMQDGGSGIKTADARAYLAGLPAVKRKAYEALAKRVEAINRDTRKLLVSSGLEKQTTIDAWEAAYGDEYVPLMREEMDDGTTGIGQGYSVRGSASKRAMGSDKPVANIIANIALQRERTITRAEKKRVGEALYGLVLKAPNDEFWFAIDPQLSPSNVMATQMQLIAMGLDPADAESIAQEPKSRYVDKRTGLVTERINPALRGMDNVLAVRIDGEDKFVFFNKEDPRAMRMVTALKNLDADQLGTVMGTVAKMTRWFASVNTQFNPVFGVTNITRDVQTALLNLSSTPLKNHRADVLKHTLSALRGIYIDLRDHRAGKQPSSVWAGLFEEFQREGGATGYRDMYANAQERAEKIAAELRAVNDGTAMKLGKGIMGWLSDYNETMENAVRLAAYKVGKEQGLSNQQAASLAKNLTVNFNRKGQVALQVGALYAFFNASTQGMARMGQTMFEGGKLSATGRKILSGGILLGSMQALLLAAAGFDDDEPPDFVRQRALVLPVGDGKYVAIPMPLGFHVIPNLGRIPTEWAMGGFKDTTKYLAQIVDVASDAFNPIGSAGLSLQTIAPTVIDPLAALSENRDWTGKPIAKKDFDSTRPTAGHTRAKDTATPWAKMISYGINIATGGTEYKPGMASPTPDQIDYLIGQVTGGVGREVGKLAQVAGGTMSGEDVPLHKIPLVGRFVGTTEGQAAEASRFYDNLREIGSHKVELDGLRKDRKGREMMEYLRENPPARMVKLADKIQRDVSELQKRKRELVKKNTPRDQVKLVERQITQKMRMLNERVQRMEATAN